MSDDRVTFRPTGHIPLPTGAVIHSFDPAAPDDPIARLRAIAEELRSIAADARASAERISAALAASEQGVGMTDKSAPIWSWADIEPADEEAGHL